MPFPALRAPQSGWRPRSGTSERSNPIQSRRTRVVPVPEEGDFDMSPDARCPAKDFNYADRAIGPDFHALLKGLRDEAPAVYSEQLDGHWIITRYDAVVAAAMDTTTFSSAQGVMIPSPGHAARAVPLESDPPEHTRYRKFLLPRFRKAETRKLEEGIRAIVLNSLAKVVEQGECDLVEALTDVVPCIAIAELLGLPEEDRESWRHRAVTVLRSAYEGDAETNAKASQEMGAYLYAAVETRRGAPDDGGLLWQLANDEIEGESLTTEMALGIAILVLFAGHDTTAQVASSLFYLLATRPDLRSTLIENPDRIPDFIEEGLRFDTSVTGMARTATCPHQVDGQQIAEGDKVLLMFTSGNRDERVFPNPDEFDLDRRGRPHLAFGWGPHRCLGEHIARLELRLMIEEVLRLIPDFQLADGFVPEYNAGVSRGVTSLPVAFRPVSTVGASV